MFISTYPGGADIGQPQSSDKIHAGVGLAVKLLLSDWMSKRPLRRFESQEKLNEVKFEICCVIEREMAFTQYTQSQLAIVLGTSQGNLSKVTNKRVDHLTFNQLFRYLTILSPFFEILIAPH